MSDQKYHQALTANRKLLAENARLKAEVAELKNQPDPLTAYLYAAELAKDEVTRLKAEVERLKEAWVDNKMQEDRDYLLQQVERLRKAGDEMHRAIKVSDPILDWKIELWNAAKEGKPSV